MKRPLDRPVRLTPIQLAPLVSAVRATFKPAEIWLFGSRARGDSRPDSDWDLLVVLPDNAPDELTDPVETWRIARSTCLPVTLLATKVRDLEAIWGIPNTIWYDLSREGVRLVD